MQIMCIYMQVCVNEIRKCVRLYFPWCQFKVQLLSFCYGNDGFTVTNYASKIIWSRHLKILYLARHNFVIPQGYFPFSSSFLDNTEFVMLNAWVYLLMIKKIFFTISLSMSSIHIFNNSLFLNPYKSNANDSDSATDCHDTDLCPCPLSMPHCIVFNTVSKVFHF